MKRSVLLSFGISLFFVCATAQERVKFGDVTPEEVRATVYDKDPEAAAVVLYESLSTRYDFRTTQLLIVNSYFVRFKILTNDGLDYANQSVSVYVGNSRTNSDDLSGLSGNTYNWEDGKVVKTKLSKEHIFVEKVSENKNRTKFTFQAVKPGSIIEYKYEIISPHYGYLDDFIFQRSIPVKYSRYELLIPEYFRFSKEVKGISPVKVTEKDENQTFMLPGGRISCISRNLLFEAKDLPGLKDERFVWSIKDYLARVTFELKAIEIPGSLHENFSNTWSQVDERLLDFNNFGKQFNHKLFKEELASLVKPEMTSNDKISAIYNMVRSKVKWNDERTLWAKNPKDALKKGLGSSGEINALLICALREAGFDAYPVVLSLRPSGRIPITHPTIDNLNYFIVGVDADNLTIYMDASAQYGTLNVLPPICMTDFARSIRKNSLSGWVNLSAINKGRLVANLEIEFNADGVLSGKIQEVTNGEMQYGFLSRYNGYQDQEKYIEWRQTEDNIQIADFNLSGNQGGAEKTLVKFNFTRNDVTNQEDVIYFNPILVPIFKENPFKEETRDLPVEFSYPYSVVIHSKIKIPKEYTLEEVPSPGRLNFNEKDILFSYICQYDENEHTVVVSVRLILDRIIYNQAEYAQLRDYFAHLVSVNNTQIVLKKK